jgi:ankyrin repeat protein
VNKFITAIKELDLRAIEKLTAKDPKWFGWAEPSGKNALHYLCGINVEGDQAKADTSLEILKYLLKGGIDIDSVHRIEEKNCNYFPATPLWYAYAKGRNEKLYKYLLKKGANPDNCMWAISWCDDVEAAKLFIKHGAKLGENPGLNDLFLGAFAWRKYKFAEWLLTEGAEADAPGPRGMTALMFAVKRKEEDTIKMLLKYGADPDLESEEGMSARKLAEEKGPRRIANLL